AVHRTGVMAMQPAPLASQLQALLAETDLETVRDRLCPLLAEALGVPSAPVVGFYKTADNESELKTCFFNGSASPLEEVEKELRFRHLPLGVAVVQKGRTKNAFPSLRERLSPPVNGYEVVALAAKVATGGEGTAGWRVVSI